MSEVATGSCFLCQGGESHAMPITGNALNNCLPPMHQDSHGAPSPLIAPQQFRRHHRHSASLVLSLSLGSSIVLRTWAHDHKLTLCF